MSHSVFGPPLAECAICSLREGCEQRKFVTSHVGKNYRPGGLMLVSEFPAKIDVQQGRPLTGRVGQLLDALLESAGIDPESTWKTSVLLGMPKSTKPKDLKEHRTDIYACLPRLDAEITTAQPRVIVALGQLALEAFTGHAETKQRLLDNPCDRCNPETRKIGPVIQCFNGACKHTVDVPKFTRVDEVTGEVGVDKAALDAWRDDFLARNPNCLMCDTSWKRAKPKMLACPECGGKKKRVGEETLFRVDRVLTGREGVVGAVFHAADLPGNLTELGVKYMIPTYSPGMLILPTRDGAKAGKFLVGGQFAARAAVDHLKKAHQLLTREARFHVDVLSTANVSDRTAAQMLVDYTREPGDFTVDIETNSKKGPWGVTRIVCIGIHRIGREDGLVVDTRRIGDKWYPGNPVYDALMAFLESKAHGKVFHNGPYDLVVMLRMWGVEVEGVIGDTLAAHNACYPDEEHGLGFCAHELTDAPAWKGGEAKTESEWEAQAELSGYRTFDDLALYNARDLVATAGVWTALAGHGTAPGRLDVEGVRSAFHVDMQMYPIGIEMEVAGLPLSQDALDKVDREQSAELATLLAQMREQIGEPDFIPTPKSLVWALHAEDGPLRLPVYATTDKTQQPKLDQETLKLYRKEPFVDTLLKYKKIEYNLSHFVRSEELRTASDGRLHPVWKVWGAKTGRWTSNPNVQNWPGWMRAVFVAPEGRTFVGADQSQLEFRIMASLSGDENLIHRCSTADESDKLNPECDPHSYVASLVFGASFTMLDRKDPAHKKTAPGEPPCKCQKCQRATLRDIVKRVVYGLNYGAGAQTVLDAIYNGGYDGAPLTVAFIERVTGIYFRAFPKVPLWRNEIVRVAEETREIRSPLYKRHRIFPLGGMEPSVIYNYPIQSGGADIMAHGLMRLRPRLRQVDPTAMFIAQIHDAIYIECDEKRAQDVAEVVTQSMSFEMSLAPGAPPMPYVASAAIGPNLAAVK